MGNAAFGREVEFGFINESAYNEAWGSPTLVGIYLKEPPDWAPTIERIKEPHAHGRPTLKLGDFAQGVRGWNARISAIVPKEGLGWLLLSLFGKLTTTPDATYYIHGFNVGSNTPASLKCLIKTAIRNTSDVEWRLRGAMVRSFEITWVPNEPLLFTMELIGGGWTKENVASSITIPVPSGNPFWYFNDSDDGAAVCTIGAVTGWNRVTSRYESILAEDIEDSYTLDSDEEQRKRLERAAAEESFRGIVTAKRILTDVNRITAFDAHSDVACNLVIGSGSSYQLQWTMSKGRIIDLKHTPKGHGIIHEEVTIEGHEVASTDMLITYRDKQSAPATQGS